MSTNTKQSTHQEQELLHIKELETAQTLLEEFNDHVALRNYHKARICLEKANTIVGKFSENNRFSAKIQTKRNLIFIDFLKKSQKLSITLENWENAVRFCESLNKFDTENFENDYNSALCYLKINDITSSQAFLEKAVKIVEKEPETSQSRKERELMISTLKDSMAQPRRGERELFYSSDSIKDSSVPETQSAVVVKPSISKMRVFVGFVLGSATFSLIYAATVHPQGREMWGKLAKNHKKLEQLTEEVQTLPLLNQVAVASSVGLTVAGCIWTESFKKKFACCAVGVGCVFAAWKLSK